MPISLARFIRQMLRPYPLSIFVMMTVAVVWAVQTSLLPYMLKVMLNRMTADPEADPFGALIGPIGIYLGMSFTMSTVFRLYDYFVAYRMIPVLRKKISTTCLNHLLKLSHQFYQNSFAGSLGSKVSELVMAIPDLLQIVIDRFFSHFLALFIAAFTLWQVNARFALILAIWSLLFLSVSLLASGHLTRLAAEWSFKGHLVTGRMVDTLSNILTVRLFARRKDEDAWLIATIDEAKDAESALEWSYFKIWLLYGYGFLLAQCCNFYFLLQGRAEGWITVGDFALVLGLNLSVMEFLWQLTKEFSKFSKLQGRIRQNLADIMVKPEIQDETNATDLSLTRGVITFENVRFQYAGTDPLFQNKSVTIGSGQKVGLVGYSGGGKSTFVNLILRMYDVTSGRILIDGQDIREVTQDSLHAVIGMIPQDPSLFHRTLRENIHYGLPTASENEVIEAAKRAHAHEFIMQLPEGYDSLVGERGVKLSGGQRQRIAIARAILKNAPILILDEATSQLDSVTESFIQESLWEVMEGKTTIVVAHRLSTLLHMDRILVFDRGKILEDGTHQELLTKAGLYKTLWDAQVGGFLPDKKVDP
ncbi:MAG: ABC transporter ATP-binding protein [Alphaproteobacteria bacterium]|nr:ABC transporter ATP-binding protein [Alphaproteobacteria bacterium]